MKLQNKVVKRMLNSFELKKNVSLRLSVSREDYHCEPDPGSAGRQADNAHE